MLHDAFPRHTPPGDPSEGVVYHRIFLSPEESPRMRVFLNICVLQGGVVSTSPNPKVGGPPLVGCPRLLIQFIRSYLPYRRPFLCGLVTSSFISVQWSLEQVVESGIAFALFSGDSYLESRYTYRISQVYFVLLLDSFRQTARWYHEFSRKCFQSFPLHHLISPFPATLNIQNDW